MPHGPLKPVSVSLVVRRAWRELGDRPLELSPSGVDGLVQMLQDLGRLSPLERLGGEPRCGVDEDEGGNSLGPSGSEHGDDEASLRHAEQGHLL